MNRSERLLLVDDEEGILKLLEITLKKERFVSIFTCTSGREALTLLQRPPFDVILLDIMLPDIHGFELCNQIRAITNAPLIFISACSSDFDKLTGLGIGGDDYITKPFNPMEVVARIQALLRRQNITRSVPNETIHHKEYRYGNLVLKPADACLSVDDQPIECTAKELELLTFFFKNPNRIYTSNQIYQFVWGEDPHYGGEKTVAMHISKIRKKLETNPRIPEVIVNLKGIGYKFIPPV
ncbi:DNA-binding response OmpR family regulator [Paenibacillus cellulosilyticus]|uniref:DNA-binding response OmpR family regulator n=1 Tax=Paenibacillus cellulosilyticus TaxID=375489 RepID=A0A2V2YC28_9BACL|nr:response regulator transcription factor [Paenibacillus cellulosilyticus]PWV89409.1 DNA-binding response OmpR family regulator [Paenibacillus cellulosilyticus]QKS47300.1 response regulator transcription factor [Paenibacillus cellulosilyticus]